MVKKNFAQGIEAILGEEKIEIERKPKHSPNGKQFPQKLEERTSIIMDAELLEKLRAIVYWDRTTIKTEIENAIQSYLDAKEDGIVDQAVKHFREKKPSGKIK